MRPPSFPMRVLGHPIVALCCLGLGGLYLYAAYHAAGVGWQLGIGGVVLVCTVGNASQQRQRYKAWQREWEGDQPKRPSTNTVIAMIVTVIVLVAAVGFGHAGEPDGAFLTRVGIGYAVFFGPLLLWMTTRPLFRRRPRRLAKAMPVAAVTGGSVLPVPSLARARDALPDYCKRLD